MLCISSCHKIEFGRALLWRRRIQPHKHSKQHERRLFHDAAKRRNRGYCWYDHFRVLREWCWSLLTKCTPLCSTADSIEPETSFSINHSGYETEATGIPVFPWQLHDMLHDAEADGFTDIVSWEEGGRSFRVHDRNAFITTILPSYFHGQKHYKSFQRQCK